MSLEDDRFIRAGCSANADIVLDSVEDVVGLDEGALKFEEGSPYVEVEIGEDTFERRDVVVGLSDGLTVEVVEGLEEGEAVKRREKPAG
jgi:HlyD family secretion protein